MPLQKLTYRPGLNREGTNYSNEGGFYDGDKIRFRSGQAEKIGGWIQADADQFLGIARSLWTWIDTDGFSNYISLGTNIKYYIYFGGSYYDITPIYRISSTASAAPFNLPANPLATTSGSPIVTITDNNYNPSVGDYVIVTSSASVGGLNVNGEYIVTAVPSTVTFQITLASNASSTATGGGTVTVEYEYPTGSITSTGGTGWGAGPWSPTVPVTLGTNPFATVSGTSTVTVSQTAHGLIPGNYVAFLGAANSPPLPNSDIPSFNGIPTNALQGTFVVQTTTLNSYTVNLPEEAATALNVGSTYTIATTGNTNWLAIGAASTAVGTVFTKNATVATGTGTAYITATATGSGGGTGIVVYPQFGSRGWGTAYSSGIAGSLRLWSNDNYGADLVLAPRGGPIFYWKDSTGVSVRASSLATLANSTTLTSTTATFGSGVNTITVTDPSDIFPFAYITGTNIAPNTQVTGSYIPGSTSVPISTNTLGVNDGNDYSFSYPGSYVPNSTNEIITSSIQQFVIALGANSYSPSSTNTSFNPMLVRWSDQGNQYQWVPQVTNQSGEFTLSNGSFIMCGISTRQENLIWTNSCLYSMQYVGYPFAWSFQVLMDNISIISPNSPITVNNVTYWMGKDKFYMYTGVVQTLPSSLRQYVFNDLNEDQAFQIFGGSNEAYNEVWWFYCSKNSDTIDRYVIYNYLDKVWSYGTMARTAWLQYGINPYPIAADYNSRLLYHEIGTDDVSTASPQPITAYIQSSDFGIDAGDHLGFVWRVLPDVNFNGSTVNNPSVTMTLYSKQNSGTSPIPGDVNDVVSSQNYTSISQYTVQTYDGQVYTRVRGRQLSFKIESTQLGVAWQLGIPRIDVKPDGRR
tara:strand:+ start:7705 stop:10284 length:2580 start_codon:yes stop_codon:yes gene_type:complete